MSEPSDITARRAPTARQHRRRPAFNAWLGIHSTGSMTSKSYAGFRSGHAQYPATASGSPSAVAIPTDKLKLRSVSDAAGFVVPFGAVGSRNQRISEENFSWRVGAQYDVTDDVMAYASVARGYKGPGFNLTIDPRAPLIMPEIPTSYEAGISRRCSIAT